MRGQFGGLDGGLGRPVRREAEQIVQLTENAVARTEIGAGR